MVEYMKQVVLVRLFNSWLVRGRKRKRKKEKGKWATLYILRRARVILEFELSLRAGRNREGRAGEQDDGEG